MALGGNSNTTSTESFLNYEPITRDPGLALTFAVLSFSLIVNCGIPLWIKWFKKYVLERRKAKDGDGDNVNRPADNIVIATSSSSGFLSGERPSREATSKGEGQQLQRQEQLQQEQQATSVETVQAAGGDGTSTPVTPTQKASDISSLLESILSKLSFSSSPTTPVATPTASDDAADAALNPTSPDNGSVDYEQPQEPASSTTLTSSALSPDNRWFMLSASDDNCNNNLRSYDEDDEDDVSMASIASSIASSIVSSVLDGPRLSHHVAKKKARRNRGARAGQRLAQRFASGAGKDHEMKDQSRPTAPTPHLVDPPGDRVPSYDENEDGLSSIGASRQGTTTNMTTGQATLKDSAQETKDGKNVSIQQGMYQVSFADANFQQRFDMILDIAAFDREMYKLVKLAVPFTMSGILEGVFNLLFVSIIGYWIGLRSANAYVVITILSELTDTINYGFSEALGNLGPQAEGAGNKKLVGQYLQLSTLFYTVGGIPIVFLWKFYAESAVLWFGFDIETARIAGQYAIPYNILQIIMGLDDILQEFLNFNDHEYYSLVTSTFSYMTECLTIMFVVGYLEIIDLEFVGYAQVAMFTVFVILNYSVVILYMGWLDGDYWEGYAKSWAFNNKKAVKNLLKTSIPLSLSWILTYGEWEIMTLIVSFMGPAEVAAWGLLGFLWGLFEYVTDAVADAGEVRVGHHMGAGRPNKARRAGYKAIYAAFVTSVFVTSLMYMFAKHIVTWVSPDLTIQRMIYEMLPLVGYSQVGLVVATVCWAILGAQGRYNLATRITFAGSWLIAIPWTLLTVLALRWNLAGPVSALVIGYTCSGAAMIACVITTNWQYYSDKVVAQNEDSLSSGSSDEYSSDGSSPAGGGCKFDKYDWKELPKDAKDAAKALGYNKRIWDDDESVDMDWNELSIEQRKAAEVLGYTHEIWDGTAPALPSNNSNDTNDQSIPASEPEPCTTSSSSDDGKGSKYEDYDWDELPKKAKIAAELLGYNEILWDKDGDVPSADLCWDELSLEQRSAARVLGYDKAGWDEDSSSSSSSSNSSVDGASYRTPMPSNPKNGNLPPQSLSTNVNTAVASSPSSSDGIHTTVPTVAPTAANPVPADQESMPNYEDYDWEELPQEIQKACEALGYSEKIWQEGGLTSVEDKDWDELTATERLAAERLGYTEKSWND